MKRKIKGLLKLTESQKNHMHRVNEIHTKSVGDKYKAGMEITEAWVDKTNCVCVRLLNGDWYHYYSNGSWA